MSVVRVGFAHPTLADVIEAHTEIRRGILAALKSLHRIGSTPKLGFEWFNHFQIEDALIHVPLLARLS